MANYPWVCGACTASNPAFTVSCRECGCPEVSSLSTQQKYRAQYDASKPKVSTHTEAPVSDELLCAKCGDPYNEFIAACFNCNQQFWCEWRADWYSNPLTRVSMGQSPDGRFYGKATLMVALAFVVYLIGAIILDESVQASGGGILGIGAAMVFSAYEVWAFTHGRRTSIDRWQYDAAPGNTWIRVLGLVFDVIFFLGCLYAIFIQA